MPVAAPRAAREFSLADDHQSAAPTFSERLFGTQGEREFQQCRPSYGRARSGIRRSRDQRPSGAQMARSTTSNATLWARIAASRYGT